MCFTVYAFVGSFALDAANPMASPVAGKVLIVFTCLFIVAFATTRGPLVWAVVGEMYPSRYRAPAMAVATTSNWLLNFLISFFTTFITNAIHYFYGLVFGGCCLSLFFIVYMFMMETDRSLEEIDTNVSSICQSSKVRKFGFDTHPGCGREHACCSGGIDGSNGAAKDFYCPISPHMMCEISWCLNGSCIEVVTVRVLGVNCCIAELAGVVGPPRLAKMHGYVPW